MSLYAIGDLHLSLGADKPMDVFGGWDGYIEKIRSGFSRLEQDDLCVLCGDTSWGMSFEESLKDFKFLNELPGKKLILKGNHDYWWATAVKMKAFFRDNGIENIDILYNNSCIYECGVAICGTRGWLMDEVTDVAYNRKIMAREVTRLGLSLKSAGEAPVKLCFFHYPPRFKNMVCRDIIAVMNDYGVKNCWYGHIHGTGHRFAVQGNVDGISYEMVSADFVDFEPQKIL